MPRILFPDGRTQSFEKEINGFISYNLPNNLLGIIWKGKYKGQKQKWFIMKFTGKESEINISTNKPEFSDWKWISPETITDKVVDFKLDVYEKFLSNNIINYSTINFSTFYQTNCFR